MKQPQCSVSYLSSCVPPVITGEEIETESLLLPSIHPVHRTADGDMWELHKERCLHCTDDKTGFPGDLLEILGRYVPWI